MNENKEGQLLDLVNSSGYPLQIGIEELVKQTSRIHQWLVVGREHFWRNTELKQEGFIDLILSKNNLRMLVECKRVLDKDWIFLVTDIKEYQRYKAKLLRSLVKSVDSYYEWVDIDCGPRSLESQFCIMGREKDRPSLEKLSSDLLLAMDSLAIEESAIRLSNPIADPIQTAYIPVIITTADLQICSFHPSEVNLDDGKVSTASNFTKLDYIRFRKGLSTANFNNLQTVRDLKESNKQNERTVFVVKASKLVDFLIGFG
jgi:hypothetical protein